MRSFGDQNDHDFIQRQPAGSNCFETKQCQNVKQYNHDCFDCQRNARYDIKKPAQRDYDYQYTVQLQHILLSLSIGSKSLNLRKKAGVNFNNLFL